MRRRPPFVVAIAGFDPSCGAGVVADARSIEAMGAAPLGVVTSITVQSGRGVRASIPLPAARVVAQLDELLGNLPVAAVKIGQVPTAAVARALARQLGDRGIPIVLDPVLCATGGGRLADSDVPRALGETLIPLASLLTVNLAEAGTLTGRRVASLAAMRQAAADLVALGAASVLVKGGHLKGDPVDVLHAGGRTVLLRSRRIAATMHGTGCALAAAAAARLARGDDVVGAVDEARRHVRSLLRGALRVGATGLRAPASY